MKRWSVIVAACVFCTMAAYAQQTQSSRTPQSSSQETGHVLSSDLIAWSFMQEPQPPEPAHQQPTPEPAPETQPAPNPTQTQPGAHTSPPSAEESQSQTPTAETFTGMVSKEADSYVLKVSDTTSYKLDNEQEVQPYEGKRVQVTGTLDRSLNLIHVDKVEPLT